MYTIAAWVPWNTPGAGGIGHTPASLTLRASRDYWGQQPMLRQVIIALRYRQPNCSPLQNLGSCFFIPVQPSDQIVFGAWPRDLYTLQTTASGLRFSSAPGDTIDALTLDPLTPPTDDARVRQALALALDKPPLAKVDLGTATNHLVPPGIGAYPATLSGPIARAPLSGDLARAQALWQSYVADTCGGVASRCPTLTVFELGALEVATPLEQAVMARWRAALPGIRLTQPVIPGTLIPVGDFPAPSAVNVNYAWESYPDPQSWLRTVTQTPGDPLPPSVHDARADALVARAEATVDPTARLALYHEAENTLLNDAVVVPIAQSVEGWGISPMVVNFPLDSALYISPAAWARIYLTAPAGK
jgi:ABC-type transport system substrate-binding protein